MFTGWTDPGTGPCAGIAVSYTHLERACQSNIGWSSTLAHLILMSYFNIAKELFQKSLDRPGACLLYTSQERPGHPDAAVSDGRDQRLSEIPLQSPARPADL